MASAVVTGMPQIADFAQRHIEAHAETRRNRGAVGFHLDYRYLAIAVGAPVIWKVQPLLSGQVSHTSPALSSFTVRWMAIACVAHVATSTIPVNILLIFIGIYSLYNSVTNCRCGMAPQAIPSSPAIRFSDCRPNNISCLLYTSPSPRDA